VTETFLTSTALVKSGIRRLGASGIEAPAREARWIWERVSGENAARRITQSADPVPPSIIHRFEDAVARRAAGEPLAYVLEEAAFRHLVIRSDARALIPRPETEGLVDLVLRLQPGGRVLDVGTGSGCIALSLAAEGKYDLVVAVDRSADAAALARDNVRTSGLPVRIVQGDLSLAMGEGTFDAVVSNPPYLSGGEYAALGPGVRDWEPALALASGADGLEATTRLLADSLRVVRPGGCIVLEIDSSRARQVAERAELAGWAEVSVRDDLFGRARYLTARRSE
jgi:release factor glutamine methyltransferase